MDRITRNWQVIARDHNANLLYSYLWTKGIAMYHKLLNVPTPYICIMSDDNNLTFAADMSAWKACHNALARNCLKDQHYLENIIDKTIKLCGNLNDWTETEIFNRDVSSLDNEVIIKLIDQFISKQAEVTAYGLALPLLDFGDLNFVENNLKQFLASKSSDDQYNEYFRVFTTPLRHSPALEQEQDLLRLMQKHIASPGWVEGVTSKSLSELRAIYPQFWLDLESHSQKHGWVYYVYSGPAFDERNFLEFIRDYLKKGTDPSQRLQEIDQATLQIAELREKYIKELKPDSHNEMILRLAGKVVWAKPARKDFQSKSYYHMEKLMREVGRRLGLSLGQARSIPPYMLRQALHDKHIDINFVNSQNKRHVCIPQANETVKILEGIEAQKFIQKYNPPETIASQRNIKELKGNCACRGKANGVVRIINQSADMHKMHDGDILVSYATTPAIVPAMRKASAIITDEGGLTCHAAIVSRELNIPCIVGTKIATQVFKDGDLVEVDADHGIVRKVHNNVNA